MTFTLRSTFIIAFALLLKFSTLDSMVPSGTPLDLVEYTGASVLPVLTVGPHDELELLLGREAGGNSKGKWDAFGGGKGHNEEDPTWTAAREFFEEAILEETVGWSFEETYETVSLGSKETTQVVAKHVGKERFFPLFITLISEQNFKSITENFGTARKKARKWVLKEKDGMAVVKWSDLSKAILSSRGDKQVTVAAKITYLAAGKIPSEPQEIPLRPFFVKTIRPYIEERSFTQGSDPRVLFYE